MVKASKWNEYGLELETRLRLKTFPIAFKLLKNEKDISEGSQRPVKDLGHRIALCHAFQLSRRAGAVTAMLLEDHWCHEPVIALGLMDPPDYWLEGHSRYPRDVSTLEAGSHYAEDFPRLDVGKYIGMVCSPLKTANFDPDIVIIYCDSAQLNLLLLGREWKDGYNLSNALSSHAACVYGVVPLLLEKKQRGYQVSIPCRGDHYSAMAGDDELIFSVKKENMDDLMTGLRAVEKTGSKLPHGYRLASGYSQSPNYEKISKMMGLRD
jgi:uncharacterized protein (DUF169 family)